MNPTILQALAGAAVVYFVYMTYVHPGSSRQLPVVPVYPEHSGMPRTARGTAEAGWARGGPLLGTHAFQQKSGKPFFHQGDSWRDVNY